MAQRFDIGRAPEGAQRCPSPPARRLQRPAGQRVVLGQQLRLGVRARGVQPLERFGDGTVQRAAPGAQQAAVGRVLDQGMTKLEDRLLRSPLHDRGRDHRCQARRRVRPRAAAAALPGTRARTRARSRPRPARPPLRCPTGRGAPSAGRAASPESRRWIAPRRSPSRVPR